MGTLGFWVTFAVVLAVLLVAFVLHERGERYRPTQRRGAEPHAQPRLIVADMGEAKYSRVAHAYHVSTDPQAYAKAFVPPDRKE